MAKYFELLSPRPGKDGKTYWNRVGTMFPAKDGNGFSVVLDAYPLPDKEGRVSCIAREPKPRDGDRDSGNMGGHSELNDHIPFAMEWR